MPARSEPERTNDGIEKGRANPRPGLGDRDGASADSAQRPRKTTPRPSARPRFRQSIQATVNGQARAAAAIASSNWSRFACRSLSATTQGEGMRSRSISTSRI